MMTAAPEGVGALSHEDERAGGTRGFAPEQLVACARCSRANAPTRMNCLYCGSPLPRNEESAALLRPTLRKLEEWEQGYNVVLLPRGDQGIAAEWLAEAADLLKLEVKHLRECFAARRSLPVARTASGEEAGLILKRLGAFGLSAEVFDDEALGFEVPQRRVRALELAPDALLLWASREEAPGRVPWERIALLALGRVTRRRLEVEERQGGFRRRGEIVDSRELSTDEAVLDLYTFEEGDGAGWRFRADRLDYSCLGARKSLTAGENFKTLAALLRERAAGAAYDDEYARLRPLLAPVWPPSEENESQGVRRESVGRYNREAVTVISNEAQFTRYTRLLSRLVLSGRAFVKE